MVADMPTIIKRNGAYIQSIDQNYLPTAGPNVPVCSARYRESPHYRCTRGLSHKGDHAAHGNQGDMGTAEISRYEPMYARWPREIREAKEVKKAKKAK